MPPTTRPDYKINLDGLGSLNPNTQPRSANASAANSPIEAPAGSGLRYPLGNGLGNGGAQAGPGRAGAGSPSKEYGSRLFPKRAREIQAQEGVSSQLWGPPTTGSGHSTPLRETIPESPGSDSFPDFDADQTASTTTASAPPSNSGRRTRAGTVPSRFPQMTTHNATSALGQSKSNRATPSSSPYQPGSPVALDQQAVGNAAFSSSAALLSRLRAGSMPQRSSLLNASNPFGSSVFASNWLASRERASTLQTIRSSDAPSSPRDSPADNDVRTLDYLGLVDTPQQIIGAGDLLMGQQRVNGPTIADLAALNAYNNKNTANRFRSFSVNAKEKYADVDEDELEQYEQMYSGQMTPSADNAAAAQAAAIHEAVRQHNLDVQAFANFASANRPRARTAGTLDSPSSRVLRNYLPTPSRLENSITAADLESDVGSDYNQLSSAVQNMNLNPKPSFDSGFHSQLETPTRSLWLGNIPSSTTASSLEVVFSRFGPIESSRVLTHKSCGFINFESVQSAMAAKAACNGREILPGCGPIRVGYAKEQSASNTPGANGAYPSPSPDPFVSKIRTENTIGGASNPSNGNVNADTAAAALVTPNLLELRDEIAMIVQQFGASQEDQRRMILSLEAAMSYDQYMSEIPPTPEASSNRVHDAPRLREIRKRIDNNTCTPMEIEATASDMLPEVAELSSDYLGNTVVQKLFERCQEDTKEAMLHEIAPHLAEIGVHKNGTWAAQKIIDVATTSGQMDLIVNALRPHGVNLFLDQYGNYVMQCCLKFGFPSNGFIFDTMLNRLWPVAQGRFGARAVRACLESHYATNDQKRLMAAAIAIHSVQLATNSNGALLLTWFLDTCTFPKRRSVLAPRIIPHLVHLCTHKVAYLTVLKIINQRNEMEAKDSILRALFFDEQTLTQIVSDQACGATFIYKVLTTPFLDDSIRPECQENVCNVLLRLKAQPNQGYKRLMDEIGLSTRHGGDSSMNPSSRSNSKTRNMNGHLPNLDTNQGSYRNSPMSTPQHMQHPGLQRTMSLDSNHFNNYDAGMVTPQYMPSPAMSNAGASPVNPPQLQYQQAMLAQAQAQLPRPPGFYGTPGGVNMMPVNGMPNGLSYNTAQVAGQVPDQYRQGINGSPMLPPGIGMQGGFQQQGYVSPMMGMNGGLNNYSQYGMPQYNFQQGQMQGQMGGSRRGRR